MAENTEEIQNEEVEVSLTALKIIRKGKGLYQIGGDIFCVFPLLGTKIEEDKVTFEYEPYRVIVEWENGEDGERLNPHWRREYKTLVIDEEEGDTE